VEDRLVSLTATSFAPFADQLVPLVYSAGASYFDVLFGSADAAITELNRWCARSNSEYYLGRADIVLDDDIAAAVVIHLSGRQTIECRRADLLACLKFLLSKRSKTGAGDLHAAPPSLADDEHYIRTIAVDPARRGRGYAKLLLARIREHALSLGSRALRLDVAVDNAPGLALYERMGFELGDRWPCPGGDMVAMVMPLGGPHRA
jgi:ribosomal protein S18 acetylase RimI-like enzyme